MSAPIVQTTYQQLELAARGFENAEQHMRQVGSQLTQKVTQMRQGGWIAEGADQFYREFDQDISPALMRLHRSLEQAARVTREISRLIKAADEEAAGHLQGEGGNPDRASMFQPVAFFAKQSNPDQERINALIGRFRNRENEGANPLQAGMIGALPAAGIAVAADGPLPIGDIIAIGILGTALIGGLIMMANSSDSSSSSANVDEEKIGRVIGESESATGNATSGEALNDDEALDALDKWVGDDMEEISPGVFRSRQPNPDGSYNQGRIDNNSLEGNHPPDVPHIHLERVRPDPLRPGRWNTESNNHIPLSPP